LPLGQRHQFRDAVRLYRRVHCEHVRDRTEQHDRSEITFQVVGQFMVDRKVDRAGADRALYQRVAVGRGTGRRLGADVAAGTGTILDDNLLAQSAPGALGDHTRDQVGRPAGGERNDQVDRPRRITLFLVA
jgi:hypothetical protein